MATNNNDLVYPEFFKVHFAYLGSESLQIPHAFIRYLPKPLPRRVILLSCWGNSWTVKLTETCTGVYLGDGWKKFVKDNDLKDGEFLVFKYDGSRTFGVDIYGLSDCKKERARIEISEISDDDDEDEDKVYADSSSYDVGDESSSFYSPVNESETEDEEEESESENEFELKTSGQKRSQGFHGREKKGRKRKGSPSAQAQRYPVTFNPVTEYLLDPLNPFMIVRLKKKISELRVSSMIIKDYGLKFGESVHFIDQLGNPMKAKTKIWSDRRVCIKGWIRICRRNRLKPSDKIICEFLCDGCWVRFIKVHVIPDGFKAG